MHVQYNNMYIVLLLQLHILDRIFHLPLFILDDQILEDPLKD